MKLTLVEIQKETPRASTFLFAPDTPVYYQPGKHISIILPMEHPDSRGKVRQFTVSSSPTEKGILAITTKRGPSTFKQTLFALSKGAVIDARGPGGGFTLREGSERLVFLAGGIGITPFRSMIRFLCDTKSKRLVTLLFSEKTLENFTFKTELDEIVGHMPSLSIGYTVTQPEADLGWKGRVGRIDPGLIKNLTSERGKSLFYICGPVSFVEAMVENVKAIGVSQDRIFVEIFSGY